MKYFAIALLLAVIAFIPAAQLLRPKTSTESRFTNEDLKRMLPAGVEGWSQEDVPLGSSEASTESALKMLRLDTFVQRRYTRGSDAITVYVAYWKPGGMESRFVATHVPDVCWLDNGWERTRMRNAAQIDVEGVKLVPCEEREFAIQGHREVVLYWLIVGGKLFDFAGHNVNSPDIFTFATDLYHNMLQGVPEQVFIRISSSMREERLLSEPLFLEIMRDLEPTGVSLPVPDACRTTSPAK
jgi:hypothetical protein